MTKTEEVNAEIVIGIGAGKKICIIDVDRWIELCKYYNITPVLIGGYKDIENAKKIENAISCVNLVNKLSLRETAALISRCKYYLGNDTGTTHMAVALNKPILLVSREAKDKMDDVPQVFSSIARFKPYYKDEDKCVLLQPEHALGECRYTRVHGGCLGDQDVEDGEEPLAHCINQITVDDMIKGYKKLIDLY